MGIYIEDSKTRTVRHYYTSSKIEKAIETLLKSDDKLVYSETHVGYVVTLTDKSEDKI